ncbi:hypothetical protein ECANGB1_1641 [Enterospora canceri]|uniref:Fungal lipase-type domain-containing protein n=1 Tax=Enterospora canceri TaxID=1081671 RepID=A0A1Y1S912_9MICR|nr:hypothetical protein ECANGB1_1641 [Enterospora canceri]
MLIHSLICGLVRCSSTHDPFQEQLFDFFVNLNKFHLPDEADEVDFTSGAPGDFDYGLSGIEQDSQSSFDSYSGTTSETKIKRPRRFTVEIEITPFSWGYISNRNWCISARSNEYKKKLAYTFGSGNFVFSLTKEELEGGSVILETTNMFKTYYGEFLFRDGQNQLSLKKVDDPEYSYEMSYTVKISKRRIVHLKKKSAMIVKTIKAYTESIANMVTEKHETGVSESSMDVLSYTGSDKQGLFSNTLAIRRSVLVIIQSRSILSIIPFMRKVKVISGLYEQEYKENVNRLNGYEILNKEDEDINTLKMAKYASAAYKLEKYPEENVNLLIAENTKAEDAVDAICLEAKCNRSQLLMANTSGDSYIGFILVEHSPDTLVLAFKGTGRMDEIANDMNIEYISSPYGDFYTHQGFLKYQSVFESIWMAAILEYAKKYKNIVITGHSLGGSVAQLCYVSMVEQNILGERGLKQTGISCVSFSPAPTVDREWANKQQGYNMVSWVYENDVVPQASKGSAIFLKVCVDELGRSLNEQSKKHLLEKCRGIRNNFNEKINPLFHPGRVYHLANDEEVLKTKQLGLDDLIEIKLLSSSISDHGITNFTTIEL